MPRHFIMRNVRFVATLLPVAPVLIAFLARTALGFGQPPPGRFVDGTMTNEDIVRGAGCWWEGAGPASRGDVERARFDARPYALRRRLARRPRVLRVRVPGLRRGLDGAVLRVAPVHTAGRELGEPLLPVRAGTHQSRRGVRVRPPSG